jgi:cyd operon protein YbgT
MWYIVWFFGVLIACGASLLATLVYEFNSEDEGEVSK